MNEESMEELTTRYLDLVEEYYTESKRVSEYVRNGIFEFTLARRETDEDSITPFHIPIHLEIHPLYKVSMDDKLRLTLVSKEEPDPSHAISSEDQSGALRKRKALKEQSSAHADKDNKDKDTDEEKKRKEGLLKKKNPIYWFGIGVRNHVQVAQSHFQKSLEYVIRMANIRIELTQIEHQLRSNRL